MMTWTEWANAHGPRQLGSPPLPNGKGMGTQPKPEQLTQAAPAQWQARHTYLVPDIPLSKLFVHSMDDPYRAFKTHKSNLASSRL